MIQESRIIADLQKRVEELQNQKQTLIDRQKFLVEEGSLG